MPKRETKDLGEEKIKATAKKAATKKTTTRKKNTKKVEKAEEVKTKVKKVSKKEETIVEVPAKKRGRPRKSVEAKLETEKNTKTASVKKSTSTKKAEKTEKVKKAENKNTKTKKVATKKTATSKKVPSKSKKSSKTSKKIVSQKKTIKLFKTLSLSSLSRKKKITILEYFDLPYRYNETTVKVLAQTPKILFVYWDISDYDRDQYSLHYGENFFNDTYPVLIVKNETFGYVQEIPINDFANSWYLHLPDSRSKYSVELGRRYKNKPISDSPYIYIKDSNHIIVPNDHILFEELKPQIKYKNAKTNEITFKNISNVIKDGKILDFYSLYQVLYNVKDLNSFFDLRNPGSRKSYFNI